MDKVLTITGMRCATCVNRLTRALTPFAQQVQVTLEPPRAVLRNPDKDATLEVLSIAAAGAGKYELAWEGNASLAPMFYGNESEGWFATYKPLVLIVAFLLGATLLIHLRLPGRAWHEWMSDFMAGFFLVFAFFKLLNVKAFANAFRGYDVIAARSNAYAYAYPFIELALGVAYLSRWSPMLTNAIALALMLISAAGVLTALRKRQLLECACLGTVFRLPMSKATLIQNVSMALMAGIMLLP